MVNHDFCHPPSRLFTFERNFSIEVQLISWQAWFMLKPNYLLVKTGPNDELTSKIKKPAIF